jgi:uncharacterized SAM-binding protein YcdF (DUF218 family)
MPHDKKKKIIKYSLVGSILINFLFFIVLFTPLVELLCSTLIVDDQPIKSDVIVTLSAGGYSSKSIDYRTFTRLDKTIELLQKDYSTKVICAGGVYLGGVNKDTIASIMKTYLLRFGVNKRAILIEDNSQNTYFDIQGLLQKYKDQFDFNNSLFVTSAWHTKRVKMILLKQNVKAKVIASDPFELYPRLWTERLDNFYVIMREFGAIIYFKLKGWI